MRRYSILFNLLIACLLTSCVPSPWSSKPSDSPNQCLPSESRSSLSRMGFSIQVGAFGQLENAVRFKQSLQKRGVDAYHFRHQSGLYKVRFGDHKQYVSARREAESLQNQGLIDRFFIVYPDQYTVAQMPDIGQNGLREELVKTAQSFLGVPYLWGGQDRRKGFDCSGLMMVSYRQNGLKLPRNSRIQYGAGQRVAQQQLQKGDLVFFATQGGTRVTHVGMYAGNNRFIHAPRTGKRVQFANLTNGYWQERYVGGRTYL